MHQCVIAVVFSPQASEGVPIRFFTVLTDLVEAYYSHNMGLVTQLQFPVHKEEELEEEPGQITHILSLISTIAIPRCPCPSRRRHVFPVPQGACFFFFYLT